jgi:SOS-response transcriptional repressor LexA
VRAVAVSVRRTRAEAGAARSAAAAAAPPTDAQREVLFFVAEFMRRNGYAPSLREVADARGCAQNTARQLLHALATRGLLVRHAALPRAMTVTPRGNAELRRLTEDEK